MKTLLIATALCFVCGHALADDTQSASNTPVEQYHYGSHLDIAKVISMTPENNDCNVGPQQMTYLDSKGVQHTLAYLVLDTGDGCNR